MVILHVTTPAQVGGLERVVEALTVGHARAGHSVHVAAVVSTPESGRAFLAQLATHGVHTHQIVLPARAYRREREAVRALCRSLRPSVVHTHGYRADVATSGVARALEIPTVTTVHGFTGGGWRNRLYEWMQVQAFRRFDGVVAVSEPLASRLRAQGVPRHHVRVIVNAWSPLHSPRARSIARAELGLPSQGRCVGWVGRMTREKGADVLLEAVPFLDEDVVVSFIGDGPERAVLEARANSLGVAARVRWHGLRPEAGTLLPAFDAFALSSRTEGTPIVLFEAMAANIPIIATTVGGVPGVISEREAILVPSENPQAIADAVGRIMADPVESAARVESANRRLKTAFAVEPWLASYEELYRAVAANRPSR